MKGKYVRLRLKLLLWVALGALGAALAAVLLADVVLGGAAGTLIYRLFVWAAGALFGQSPESADLLYQQYIQANRPLAVTGAACVLLLAAFYLAMGRFTKWLDRLRGAVRGLLSDGGTAEGLPRELAPIQEDLDALRRQLSAREEAARESEQRRRDLVAFLAHDLKTPLTSVVGYLTLLQDKPDLSPEERVKFTGIALDKARRLEELLGEFFDISRMDLDSASAEKGPIQLSLLLEQLADEFYPLFADKELTCQPDIQPHLVVWGDPDKLARVFDNVLRNAVSYSAPGGRVELRAGARGPWAEIVFRNQGLAIPEGELSNIFEKFYRLDAARSTRTGGAGLGLAIAREIVELHGGSIRAESDGALTTFTVSLPLYETEHKEARRHGTRRGRAGLSESK